MKIYLCDLTHEIGCRVRAVPLGIATIACAVKDNFNDKISTKLFVYPNKIIEKLKSDPPDVLALSNYTWNSKLSLRIAKLAKSINPNILTVMGGSHCRQDQEGLKKFCKSNPFLDVYIPFEGEPPFVELIGRCLEKKTCKINKLGNVPGNFLNLTDYEFKRIVVNGEGEKHKYDSPYYAVNRYSSPYLTGMLDEFLDDPKLGVMLESNRGCPYSCTFCAWGTGSGNKLIRKNAETFLKEMWYCGARSKNMMWYLVDSNFGILKDDIKIAKEIIKIKDKYGLPKSIYYNTAKNNAKLVFEVANILGNLVPVNMSVQSFDPIVLKKMKRKNLKHEEIVQFIKMHHEEGREVNTDLLVPAGGETLESHLNSFRTAFDIGFDNINTNIINMLPGTEMESDSDREKFGFRTLWRPMDSGYGIYEGEFVFETDECIVGSNDITEEEIYGVKKVHFLTLLFWMYGLGKPLLQLALKNKTNPTDVILSLAKDKESSLSKKILNPLEEDYRNEWFKTEEDLLKHFSKSKLSKNLYSGEIEMKKLNLKYFADIITEPNLVYESISTIKDYISKNSKIDKEVIEIVFKISIDNLKLDLLNENLTKKVDYKVSKKTFEYIKKINLIPMSAEYKENGFSMTYEFWKDKFAIMKNKLKQYNYKNKPKDAVYSLVFFGGRFIYKTNTNQENSKKLKNYSYTENKVVEGNKDTPSTLH